MIEKIINFEYLEAIFLIVMVAFLLFLGIPLEDQDELERTTLLDIHKDIEVVENLINLEEDKLRLSKLDIKNRSHYLTEERLQEDKAIDKLENSLSGSPVEDKNNYYKVSTSYLEDKIKVSNEKMEYYYNPNKRKVVVLTD